MYEKDFVASCLVAHSGGNTVGRKIRVTQVDTRLTIDGMNNSRRVTSRNVDRLMGRARDN